MRGLSKIQRRWWLLLGGLAVLGVICGWGEEAHATERVVLQLRWDHQFQFAGYYAAQWQGYYTEAGLDVEIRSGVTPERTILDGIKEVQEGRADFGIGGADILVARDKGTPLVVLASIFQQSAIEFYALKQLEISSPADLVRHRVARESFGLSEVELKAMLQAEGIDPALVPPHPQKAGLEQILAGDVVAGYLIELPYHAQRLGFEITSLKPSTYGIDFYGDSLFTRAELIDQHSDVVETFVAASLRGWEYALEYPGEIARRIARELPRAYPIEDPVAFNRFQINGVNELCLYPVIKLGHINPNRWLRMHEFLRDLGQVEGELNLSEFIFDPAQRTQVLAEKRDWRQRVALLLSLAVSGLALGAVLILRHRQRTLRREEVRLRTVSNAVHEAIIMHKPDGTIVFVNDQMLKMYGVTREEAVSYSLLRDYSPPDESLDQLQAKWREVMEGKTCLFEWKARRPHDGSVFDVEMFFRKISLKHRDYILTTVRNITERKQTEEALQESERLFRVIFDQAFQLMGLMDPDGILLKINQTAADFIQTEVSEVLGLPFWETPWWAHSAEQQKRLRDAVLAAAKGQFVRFETTHPKPGGGLIQVDFSIKPVKDEAGKVVLLVPEGRDITERKQAEEALRTSEAKYRALIDNAGTPIIYFGIDGKIIVLNDDAARNLGGVPADLVGKSITEVLPDKAETSMERFRQVVKSGEGLEFEDLVELSTDKRWFLSHLHPVRDVEGQIFAIQIVSQDITERKQVEEKLRESERRFTDLLESVWLAAVMLDKQGNIIFCNDFLLNLTGWKREEVFGRNWFDVFIPAEIREQVLTDFFPIVQSGIYPVHYENEILTREGARRLIKWNNTLLRNPEGELIGTASIGEDVTETRRAEKALARSEERFRAIFENAASGIGLVDTDGHYVQVNQRWAEMLGYTEEELQEKTNLQITHPEDVEKSRKMLNRLIAKQIDSYRLEKRFVPRDGSVFWADLSVTPIRDAEGNLEAVIGVIIDITGRKQAEEKLQEANRELEAFVYTVSHDLRSPLTPIIGFADFLGDQYQDRLDETALDCLVEISKQGNRMLALMEDLLALAKVGHLERPIEPIDASAVVQEVVESLGGNLAASGLSLKRDQLPHIRIPKTLLVQCFDNLIGNALRYAGAKGGPVEVGGERQGDRVRFYVRDHGPGIPEHERGRIFEVFFRGATGKQIEGTGVGLATVKKIARVYGGKAWVEETPGGGSTFYFELVDVSGDVKNTDGLGTE